LNKAAVSVSLEPMKKRVNSTAFRQIMGAFATGVAVVTAHDATLGDVGLTINSLTSVSLDPPLVLFCIDKQAHLHKALRKAKAFGMNFLAKGQQDVSRHFADMRHNPAPKNMWDRKNKAAPLLRDTMGWALLEPRAFYKGGDHTIFLCEVTDLKKSAQDEPLIYFGGRYRGLGVFKTSNDSRRRNK
jgi:flavin reductase (DIM6/NTAB) family NADH-FMN oxidoreductase RutF